MNLLFLYGAPASGKTTLGTKLALQLNRGVVDIDTLIVEREGRDIPSIFADEGEAGFRAKETAALEAVVEESRHVSRPPIIALGGGTLLSESNRRLCEAHGTVFCLDTPPEEELLRRIGAAAGSRPLGDKAKERAAHYASFPNRVAAMFDLDNSLVIVGCGIAPALAAGVPRVVDRTVADLYGLSGAESGTIATIPSGEEHKTPTTVMALWSAFAKAGLGRRDMVAAFGGGVTGDLTGFAAATWMRGIDWINVPTTLLAMVDASTGGKTGCDLPEGKNLAGAFHAPKLVVIDTNFLRTLPPALLAAGRAEMIKHEIIAGLAPSARPEFQVPNPKSQVKGSAPRPLPTAAEIAANLRVKVDIVREDPYEQTGRRMVLNCGHTVAHAVETLTRYAVSHGEAVAIGCVEEARMAVERGLAPSDWPNRLAERFSEAGLPTALPAGLTPAAMRAAMRGDKKRAGNTVTFALPCGWGDVRLVPIDLTEEADHVAP